MSRSLLTMPDVRTQRRAATTTPVELQLSDIYGMVSAVNADGAVNVPVLGISREAIGGPDEISKVYGR